MTRHNILVALISASLAVLGILLLFSVHLWPTNRDLLLHLGAEAFGLAAGTWIVEYVVSASRMRGERERIASAFALPIHHTSHMLGRLGAALETLPSSHECDDERLDDLVSGVLMQYAEWFAVARDDWDGLRSGFGGYMDALTVTSMNEIMANLRRVLDSVRDGKRLSKPIGLVIQTISLELTCIASELGLKPPRPTEMELLRMLAGKPRLLGLERGAKGKTGHGDDDKVPSSMFE